MTVQGISNPTPSRRTALQRSLWLVPALLAALAAPAVATAQAFPSKPIRVVIGFPPGTATDIIGRLVAQRLNEGNGWNMIVDNKPGQSGSMGASEVARAPADGYTLLLSAAGPMATNPNLYQNVRYDTAKDFVPITPVVNIPYVLVVSAASPYKTVAELVAAAKADPGKLNYGSPGHGTTQHLMSATLAQLTNSKFLHVPYKGSADALNGLIGGDLNLLIDTTVVTGPHIESGKLRALGVTTTTRVPAMPNIPTLAEAGVTGYDMANWLAYFAPANTPADVVARLNTEIRKVVNSPEMVDRLRKMGTEPRTSSPAEFSAFLKGELTKWADAVKTSGAKLE